MSQQNTEIDDRDGHAHPSPASSSSSSDGVQPQPQPLSVGECGDGADQRHWQSAIQPDAAHAHPLQRHCRSDHQPDAVACATGGGERPDHTAAAAATGDVALAAAVEFESDPTAIRDATDVAVCSGHIDSSATDADTTRAATAAVTVSPLSRLATVELQLIMRCCDQSTLIALAQCSRFTLAVASRSFAWQSLSPIQLQCDSPLELSGRLMPSLLRHADISITWRLRSKTAVTADQVSALAALPRLRGLTIESAYDPSEGNWVALSDESVALLIAALDERIDHGGALTSMGVRSSPIGEAGGVALAAFIARSRTLTSLDFTCALGQSSETTRMLADAIQQSVSLETLEMFHFGRGDPAATALTAAVAQNYSLAELRLHGCRIGDAGVEALTAALEQGGCIRKLYLDCAGFGSVGAVALARLLVSDRCALTSLTLFHDIVPGNRIGREGALALSEALHTSRTLTELRLISTGFDDDDIAALLSALQRNPHCRLRALDLSHNSLKMRHASALAGMTSGSLVDLERLGLRACGLGDEEMAVLAAGIGCSRTLQHLDLWGNSFGSFGVAALAAAFTVCPTITSLSVNGKMFGDAGMAALMPTLDNLCSLTLNDSWLTAEGAKPLADLIQRGRVLESLEISSVHLEARSLALVADVLQASSSLRTLRVQSTTGHGSGADGTAALADALIRGWKASELSLDFDPSIDDRGAVALAAAMQQLGERCTLTRLSLVHCGFTAEGALALVRAATHTPKLRTLDMRYNDNILAAARASLLAACGPQAHFEIGLELVLVDEP